MAEGNGAVAVRDPDALVKEIERTRENLARTIDTLTERVSPAHIARDAVARGRDKLAEPRSRLAGGLALATAATVMYLAWRRRK